MRYKQLALLALPAIALAVTACTALPAVKPTSTGPVVVTPARAPESIREASIQGTVSVQGGCFVLSNDAGTWLLEWPFGSSLNGADGSVSVPDYGIVSVGDKIHAGGGYAESHDQCPGQTLDGTASVDLFVTTE